MTTIKDAPLIEQVIGIEKIPVSDNSGLPKAITTEQLKNYIDVPNETTVEDWGFTKNKGDYSKPSSGIPKSDLSEEVKNSLNKADSALQEHQSLRGYATETYVANAIEQAITNTLNTEV